MILVRHGVSLPLMAIAVTDRGFDLSWWVAGDLFLAGRGAATHQQVKIESTRIEKTTSADTVPLSPHHTHAHTNL